MGYWPLGLMETLKTCFLTGVLFAAPLYECLVVDGVWREWVDGLEPLRQVWAEWPAWRNYVAVSVFSCLISSRLIVISCRVVSLATDNDPSFTHPIRF